MSGGIASSASATGAIETTGTSAVSSEGSSVSTSPSAGSGASGGSSSTGGVESPLVAFCRPPCDRASDCAGDGPYFDEDNYECVDGGCIWIGCTADSDCPDASQVCRPTDDGTGVYNFCVQSCENPDACGQGMGPYVPSNYSCIDGGCIFDGCSADAECEDVSPGTRCVPEQSKFCLRPCTVPGDCTTGAGAAWDADNFACERGVCVYLGCNGDRECDGEQVCQAPT